MDFWRAYRLLARRKWIIMAAVLLTTTLVGLGSFTKLKKYDATTSIGPTEYAVRKAVSVTLTDDKNQPLLTEDNWMNEAKRTATGITGSGNITKSIWNLGYAGVLRGELKPALDGLPDDEEGLVSAESPDAVRKAVGVALARMEAGYEGTKSASELVKSTGMSTDIWAIFIYLRNKLDALPGESPLGSTDREVMAHSIQKRVKDVESEAIKAIPVNYRTVILQVRDSDPRVAEILASAMTATYRQAYNLDSVRKAQDMKTFYEGQEKAARQGYKTAQEALRRFRTTNRDRFMQDQVANAIKVHEQTKNSLEDVNASLRDIDAQIIASRARLASIPRMLTHTKQEENPKIAQLRDQINTLSVQLADAQGTYTADHPDVKRLKARIASLQDDLKGVQGTMLENKTVTENPEWLEREREIAGFVQRRQGLSARVSTLNKVIAEKESIINSLPDAQTQTETLLRAFSNASERLSDVTRKMNQAGEEVAQARNGALDVNYWAGTESTPNHQEIPAYLGTRNTMIGLVVLAFLLSLLGSAAIILAFDFMDTSVKTPVDVQRMLDAPVTGIVPRLPGPDRALMPRITHNLPASPHAESYRFLGTDILLSAAEEPFKTVMVATAKPNQGGTATICNLAITLAQAGQSVALVDADLRRPSLHNIFNLSNEVGLSTVLGNGKLPSDALQRTDVENLYVMTGGPAPENAWQLLRSPKMRETITDLARDFDFVLFDTPSAVVFADAATIATMVDGVLMVVRANEAPSGSEMQVKNLLNKTRARIVGVVLNDMPMEQVDSARYFEHYYNHDGKGEKAVAAGSGRPALPKRPSDDEI